MIAAKQALRLGLAALLGAAYLALGHIAASSEHPPVVAIVVGLIPLGLGALLLAWHAPRRHLCVAAWLAVAGVVVWQIDALTRNVAWLYFLQHAGAMVLLGLTFGSSLWSDHASALCSRIASLVYRSPLDADYLHYTWNVTFAWTLFFSISAVISVLLFFFGRIEIWSAFANLLTPPLLGAMFVGEYLIRVRVLPNRKHFSIAETIQAYREYSQRQR